MISFKANFFKMNKGPKCQPAYFSTVRNNVMKKLSLSSGEGLLIKTGNNVFPTVLRKHGSNRVSYGFTVPHKIANNLQKNPEFILLSKNIRKISYINKKNHLNLLKIIPPKTIRKFNMYKFNYENNKILFWIFSKGNKPYALPKFVPLRKNEFSLLEVFGAFNCEGAKYRKKNRHRDKLSFSNAEIEQINWFMISLKKLLDIDEKEWKLQIFYPKIDEQNKKRLLVHWEQLGIAIENISFIRNNRISAPYGIGILNIFNSTLSEVFYYLMKYCKKIACNSRANAIDVFRGFSRGDMGVIENTITFDDEERSNLILFRNVCNKLGIETGSIKFNPGKKGWWNIRITHRENFKKILRFDGIKHSERKERIIKDFLNNRKLSIYKYLKSISNGFGDSVSLSKRLNLSVITTRFYLSKLRKEGYLNIKKLGNHNKILYKLTKGGKKEFAFYKNLEKQLVK